jgi:molybdopterin molybdotransferase
LAYVAPDPLPPVDRPVPAAIGHVLAAPIVARSPLPPFDAAAMDGYAVAGAGPWRLAARALAGSGEPAPLDPGCACEIATGAMVPAGAIAVLPYEDAARSGEVVDGTVTPGRHVRRAGEECAAGELLVGAGAVATAPTVGLAAAVGYDVLRVHPRPRVALLVIGDELLTGGLPRAGRIRDALGPQLPALVGGCGGVPGHVRHVADRVDALASAVASAGADVVVTTGGSSVGPADHLPRVLAGVSAEFVVRGVACRPGHPQLLARLPDGRWLVGLPGNPLAALCGVVTLLAPLLARLAGKGMPRTGTATVGGLPPATATVTRLVPVLFGQTGGGMALHYGGSAMLRGVARADGFAVIEPGTDLPAVVEVVPLPA